LPIRRNLVPLDPALKHRPAIRLIEAVDEGAYVLVPEPELFVCPLAECRGLATVQAGSSGFFVKSQRRILNSVGLVQNREAVSGFLSGVGGVLVVPAVRVVDGEAIVLTGNTEDIGALDLGEREVGNK